MYESAPSQPKSLQDRVDADLKAKRTEFVGMPVGVWERRGDGALFVRLSTDTPPIRLCSEKKDSK